MGRGRRAGLDSEKATAIVAGIRLGAPLEVAAQAAGGARSTFWDWMRRGDEGKRPYAAFSQSVRAREAEVHVWVVGSIRQAAIHDPAVALRWSTIWRAASPKMIMGGSDEEKQDHPAQKPVVLAETPSTNHTKRGDPVYDPFVGSGTTIVAAEQLSRRCYAMDTDPRYVQVSIERWERFTGKTAEKLDG